MDQPSEKITRFLILFVIWVILIKSLSGAGLFEPKTHNGKGYFVRVPEGWFKVKEKKGVVHPQGVEIVRFLPKGIDYEIEKPEASISVYSKKLITPIWIEDEFPDIVKSLHESGFEIKDKGQIKVDERLSGWIVYYDSKALVLNLEFYMVSENNMYYKILYSAHPDKFQHYRHSFEELKNSFKFKFSIY